MKNLSWMISEDWAVSPMFLRLSDCPTKAAEVQKIIDEHLVMRSQRKARRIERALLKEAASAATVAEACVIGSESPSGH